MEAVSKMRNLSYCMNKAIDNGYTANFQVKEALLLHVDSGQSYQPEQVHVVDYFRFEGESDPADNSILYLIETSDGRKGTIADAYGIYASRKIGDFFVSVQDIHKKKSTQG